MEKGTYEFRENSIVVSIPFTRVSTEDEDPRWTQDRTQDGTQEDSKGSSEDEKIKRILEFCQTPKGILEITEMLGYSGRKPTKKYVKPLAEQGHLAMTIPDKPQSKNQKYVTVPIEEIQAAVDGTISPEQAVKLRQCLEHIDELKKHKSEIERETFRLSDKYEVALNLIRTVPGFDNHTDPIHLESLVTLAPRKQSGLYPYCNADGYIYGMMVRIRALYLGIFSDNSAFPEYFLPTLPVFLQPSQHYNKYGHIFSLCLLYTQMCVLFFHILRIQQSDFHNHFQKFLSAYEPVR